VSRAPERTALYRLYGDADLLLYIGISKTFGDRWKREARTFPWWDEHCRMTVEWHNSRPEAETAEIAAIKAEHPKYNIQYNRPGSGRQPKMPASDHERKSQEWTGATMRAFRNSGGMTQKELAAEMTRRGYPWYQATVYNVESGQRPVLLSEIADFAEIFGIVAWDDAFTAPWEPLYDADGNLVRGPAAELSGTPEHAA
jgi:transcriptional regulator with XRE-family HTH domain